MSSKFKPMLAEHAEMELIHFPMLASTKLDGIRAVVLNGQLLSRKLKPIPNEYTRSLFEHPEYEGLDGELIVGSPTDPKCFNKTTSGVMSEDGEPDVHFYVFDQIPEYSPGMKLDTPFNKRFKDLKDLSIFLDHVIVVEQQVVNNYDELSSFEEKCLTEGYEGVIIKSPDSPYKYGRSTVREGYMLKIKRYKDSEAKILSVEELMSNTNEATINKLGKTERSNHKEGMVPQNTLGALVVEDIKTKVQFHIGTGFDQELRDKLWANKDSLIGKIVKYKYFGYGQVDKPRHPVFLGFRDERDMS